MKPEEIAAMASAAMDGHEESMGVGIGAKNADKGFKMVLAAVTGTGRRNLDYMKMIALWGLHFRKDRKFPADVLNFHGYGKSDAAQESSDLSPEEMDMEGQLKELVGWRDQHAPLLEVWDTEFGWDTDQRSVDRAPAYAGFTGEDVQAMWHVRGFMYGDWLLRAAFYLLEGDHCMAASLTLARTHTHTLHLTLPLPLPYLYP
jgi:hypothetical protein